MSPDYSYQETINYLYALQKHGIKLELANTVALMRLMDDPHRRFRTVHIAGTNGKGSTSAFTASILQAAGYRVGLYTSPHLVSFTERIRVNGNPISEARVVELAGRVRSGYESSTGGERLNPTFFEVTTAIAFTYFAEERVDIAVIEVGMGGRLDSTNVIMPLVSAITNIELEHTEFLGDTLQKIAAEKAGIIKRHVPVVTGTSQPEVIEVIDREAAAEDAPVYRLARDFQAQRVSGSRIQTFDYRGMNATFTGLEISLLGRHQIDNACLSLAVIECLRSQGVTVHDSAVREGLRNTRWEGRLERVGEKPALYLDGAHNPASAKKLAEAVRSMRGEFGRLLLVVGILGDKDYRGILSELVPLADHVIVTRPEYSRALDLQALAAEVRSLHSSVSAADAVGVAIEQARTNAAADDLILVTGSLYVVGDARAALITADGRNRALSGLKG